MEKNIDTIFAYREKGRIGKMFDSIAREYDFFNHFFSLGIDKRWRKKAVESVSKKGKYPIVVDLATGTGDLALQLYRTLRPQKIMGIDLSDGMLEVAKKKIAYNHLEEFIELIKGNGEKTNFPDAFCQLVSIGFGIRNFQNPKQGLQEAYRILSNGGRILILEFATPRSSFFLPFIRLYYNFFIPFIGKLLSKNQGAYHYLPQSIYKFPNGETFCQMMREVGFSEVCYRSMTFNIVNVYEGVKNPLK